MNINQHGFPTHGYAITPQSQQHTQPLSTDSNAMSAAVPENVRNAVDLRLPMTSAYTVDKKMTEWGAISIDALNAQFARLEADLTNKIKDTEVLRATELSDSAGVDSVEVGCLTLELKMKDGGTRKADSLTCACLMAMLEEYQAVAKLIDEKIKSQDGTDSAVVANIATASGSTIQLPVDGQQPFVSTASLISSNPYSTYRTYSTYSTYNLSPAFATHSPTGSFSQYPVAETYISTLGLRFQSSAARMLTGTMSEQQAHSDTAPVVRSIARVQELSGLGMKLSPMDAGMSNYLRAIFHKIQMGTRSHVLSAVVRNTNYEVHAYQVLVQGAASETVWIATREGSTDPIDVRVPGGRDETELKALKAEMQASVSMSLAKVKDVRKAPALQPPPVVPALLGGLGSVDITALVGKFMTAATKANAKTKTESSYPKARVDNLIDLGKKLGAVASNNTRADLRASLNAIFQNAVGVSQREITIESLPMRMHVYAYNVIVPNQAHHETIWLLMRAGSNRPIDVGVAGTPEAETSLKKHMHNAAIRV